MPRRPVEIDDLFRLRVVSDADMAPDGGRIVFALSRLDLKKNATYSSLYAVPAKGGGIETLISHPATMTHAAYTQAERDALGISDGLVRISVGCEDGEDLVKDLEQALASV